MTAFTIQRPSTDLVILGPTTATRPLNVSMMSGNVRKRQSTTKIMDGNLDGNGMQNEQRNCACATHL